MGSSPLVVGHIGVGLPLFCLHRIAKVISCVSIFDSALPVPWFRKGESYAYDIAANWSVSIAGRPIL
jgi:hypothetical protein